MHFLLFEGNLLLVLLQIEHSLKRNLPKDKQTSFFFRFKSAQNKLSNEVIFEFTT